MTQTEEAATIRKRIGSMPGVGYVARWALNIIRLPQRLDHIRSQLSDAHASIERLTEECKRNGLMADDHENDAFYVHFENAFRGTEQEIKDRLRVYVPRLRESKVDFKRHPVLDIGCGRGEFLDLMHDEKINAIGLDLNEDMVARSNERGFNAVQADAFDYLAKQKTGSLGAITGFHIVEHIPFGRLLRLFHECQRVLVPGGIVIFETPNPENTDVGSFTFYYDPSHLHPLAPAVLSFALETRGFAVDIVRLHPKGDGSEADGIENPHVAEVVRRFYGPRDFAVIGTKSREE